MELDNQSIISNAIFIVNFSINLSTLQCVNQKLKISMFDSVFGQLWNVSVLGYVNLTNLSSSLLSNIILSNLFGHVNPNTTQISRPNSRYIVNVSSGIQFFIDGVQVNSTVNINLKQIQYCSTFDQLSNQSMSIPVQQVNNSFQQFYSSNNIFTSFDPNLNQNAFIGLYQNNISNEMSLNLQNMFVAFVNQSNYFSFVEQNQTFQTIFFSRIRTVAYGQNNLQIQCQLPNSYYDIIQQQCVNQSACQASKYILFAMCLSACPVGYYQVVGVCYDQCPLFLGYTSQLLNNTCIQCTATQFATNTLCVSSCTQYQFKLGCYVNTCPSGTVLSTNQCVTSTFSQCSVFQQLSLYDSQQFYDECNTMVENGLLYSNTSNMTNFCSNYIRNSTCIDTTCNVNEVIQTIGKNKICRQTCIYNTVNIGGTCLSSCSSGQYSRQDLGLCFSCMQQFDGGTYWNRSSQQCVSQCQYLNISLNYYICEMPTDSVNCLYFLQISVNQFQCLQSAGNHTVSSDGHTLQFVCQQQFEDNTTKFCISVCSGGYQIVTISGYNQYQCYSPCPQQFEFQDTSQPYNNAYYCVSSCPQFVLQLTYCVSTCPNFALGNFCMSQCPAQQVIYQSSVCLSCPAGSSFQSGTCQCELSTFYNISVNKCQCAYGQFIDQLKDQNGYLLCYDYTWTIYTGSALGGLVLIVITIIIIGYFKRKIYISQRGIVHQSLKTQDKTKIQKLDQTTHETTQNSLKTTPKAIENIQNFRPKTQFRKKSQNIVNNSTAKLNNTATQSRIVQNLEKINEQSQSKIAQKVESANKSSKIIIKAEENLLSEIQQKYNEPATAKAKPRLGRQVRGK